MRGQAPAQPAAKTEENDRGEVIQVLASGTPEEVDVAGIKSRDGAETAPAVDLDSVDDQPAYGPPVTQYVVLKGGRVQSAVNAPRAVVPAGKIIDDLNYDIKLLRRQGVQVREATAEDLSLVG